MPQPSVGGGSVPYPQPTNAFIPNQTTGLIYVAPPVVTYPHLREDPVQITCRNCKADVLTQTQFESGVATWLLAGGLCLIG